MESLGPFTDSHPVIMFHKHNSDTPQTASTQTPGSPTMLHRYGSTETLSVLSRSITATSINSTSTINTTFEGHWMPNSFVVSRKRYKVSLHLKPSEIELLRKSWAIVTSTESRASDSIALEPLSRTSSMGLKLSSTVTNSSTGSSAVNNNSNNNNNNNSGNIKNDNNIINTAPIPKANQGFNTASFASFLFCIQFYNNLIGMDPEIETLIPSIKHQASAFAGVISVAIGSLEDLSKMKESLLNLGHLHARILGIDSPYFKTMGEALIKTFQDWFGNSPESFPLELEEAWIKLYCFLANSILQGGIDPVIEYNIHPNKHQTQTHDEQIDKIDENDNENEIDNAVVNDSASFSKQLSDLTSNFTAASSNIDNKKASISKTSTNQTGYTKYDPSVNSSNSFNSKPSYIPQVAHKNINRLKKSRNTKEDCTIM